MDQPEGHRPVVIVTRDKAVPVRNAITVALITSRIRHIDVEVYLDDNDGLARPCVINCDVLRTIPKTWLQQRITRLSVTKELELNRALKTALELDHEN